MSDPIELTIQSKRTVPVEEVNGYIAQLEGLGWSVEIVHLPVAVDPSLVKITGDI